MEVPLSISDILLTSLEFINAAKNMKVATLSGGFR